MYAISEEGGIYVVEFPLVTLKEDDILEEEVVMRVDGNGQPVEAAKFPSLDRAVAGAAGALLDAADAVEARLDKIEYRLEADERVDPLELYNASYLVHSLHVHAYSLRALSARLRRLGLIRQRTLEVVRSAARRAHALRRALLDLRLLYISQLQNSINSSMRRMTLISTVALPAILISSIYGMNIQLPLADSPPAVFGLMAVLTAAFALLVYKV
ncbi:MAG: CorA family divalent cation transporter [Thermoproteus sp.]|jgi:Mg2+ and Co2+ transporter CorA|nr:CorA family divalent cation transporter [Thermoproteus sp.]MDT7882251.1 CorA family divalent cation transporter [Thermoproteus sp.]